MILKLNGQRCETLPHIYSTGRGLIKIYCLRIKPRLPICKI